MASKKRANGHGRPKGTLHDVGLVPIHGPKLSPKWALRWLRESQKPLQELASILGEAAQDADARRDLGYLGYCAGAMTEACAAALESGRSVRIRSDCDPVGPSRDPLFADDEPEGNLQMVAQVLSIAAVAVSPQTETDALDDDERKLLAELIAAARLHLQHEVKRQSRVWRERFDARMAERRLERAIEAAEAEAGCAR